MSLSLTCTCGTRFEVEDTLAGQEVGCPECQQPLRVPSPSRVRVRTCDGAIVSAVLALVGSFTIIGTVLAVLIGLVAVVRIGKHRDRLAGTGYAVFGIVWGLALTALSLFAYSTGELFGVTDQIRKHQYAGELDDPAELTLTRPNDGFAISRPNHSWRLARPALQDRLDNHSSMLLLHPGKDVFVDVQIDRAWGLNLEGYLQRVIQSYQESPQGNPHANRRTLREVSGFKLLEKRMLPAEPGLELAELKVELRVYNQPIVFLIRVVKEDNGRVFQVRGWAMRRRFAREESELRVILESFRSLAHPNP